MNSDNYSYLLSIYENLDSQAPLSSPKQLYNIVKWRGITLREVKYFLSSQNSYSLHVLKRRNFLRRPIVASYKNRILCMDLIDISKIARYNDNIRFILIMMDIYSRFVSLRPMINKTAVETAQRMSEIFDTGVYKGATHMLVDEGLEFHNRTVKSLCKKNNIKLYYTYNREIKAAHCERAIFRVKSLIFKYLTHYNTPRYIPLLQKIANVLNNSTHRILGDTPHRVHFVYTRKQLFDLFHRIYKKPNVNTHSSIAVGDIVRITSTRRIDLLSKRYEIVNSEETFRVVKIDSTHPVLLYDIVDMHGEPILGRFYKEELIKINHVP